MGRRLILKHCSRQTNIFHTDVSKPERKLSETGERSSRHTVAYHGSFCIAPLNKDFQKLRTNNNLPIQISLESRLVPTHHPTQQKNYRTDPRKTERKLVATGGHSDRQNPQRHLNSTQSGVTKLNNLQGTSNLNPEPPYAGIWDHKPSYTCMSAIYTPALSLRKTQYQFSKFYSAESWTKAAHKIETRRYTFSKFVTILHASHLFWIMDIAPLGPASSIAKMEDIGDDKKHTQILRVRRSKWST